MMIGTFTADTCLGILNGLSVELQFCRNVHRKVVSGQMADKSNANEFEDTSSTVALKTSMSSNAAFAT